MEAITPEVRLMSFDEAQKAGLHSRGLTLDYEGRTYRLNAGARDNIYVFTRSVYLTLNRPLGYMGLDAYAPLEEEPIDSSCERRSGKGLYSPQERR